ncbi:hypothetical protein LUX57_12860 [Actinomadura madurae]|uniref:hypothetical protein n=1 Tax=Actinomadura madurae TaxID=1993 RepID=UPI0020D23A2D|nr:hypothetical protein [Actinomadura madurae]MCP9965903.1 hypothetical protein [Actinomadura madurae]
MMNEPTNTAITAKTSRNVRITARISLKEPVCSSMASRPVTASIPDGSLAATASRSRSWETPSSACTTIRA